MYFFGVTTAESSIMRIFPAWAKALGLGDAHLLGIDFAINDDPEKYRAAVEHIKTDPLSLGALVTTHKIDVMQAAGDLFDGFDDFAQASSEISCIFKRDGALIGGARDDESSRLCLDLLLGEHYWQKYPAEVLMLGSGGAAVACSWALLHPDLGENRPRKLTVTDIHPERLEHLEKIINPLGNIPCLETVCTDNGNELLQRLPPHSMVINATGMGKDRPGSPLTDTAIWPEHAVAWEFNYRGERQFLKQARNHAGITEDGWRYFVFGWTRVMEAVFDHPIDSSGPDFEALSEIAAALR